jgi:hypothetical protein
MIDPVAVSCQECGLELAGDSPDLRLELTCDDERIFYCEACWEGEFGERPSRRVDLNSVSHAHSRRLTVPSSLLRPSPSASPLASGTRLQERLEA